LWTLTAFSAIVLGQLANAYACRSVARPVARIGLRGNRLLGYAVAFEFAVLGIFLFLPPLPGLLGGHVPSPLGWLLALAAVPAVVLADAAAKGLGRRLIRR
jgi:hypothetical protein